MAKIDYEFDQNRSRGEDKFSRRVRLTLIFLVVAAVTAGTIWFLLPEREAKAPEIIRQPPVAVEETESEEENPASASETPATVKPPAVNTGDGVVDLPLPPEQTTAETAEPGETPENVTPLLTGEKIPEEDLTATVEPEKGKPWVHDPPASEDAPRIVPDTVPADRSAAVAEAQSRFDAGDDAGAIAAASRLLAADGVSENSATWRSAAKVLTEAHRRRLAGGKPLESLTVRYRAGSGDSYSRVAARNHMTIEALKLENGVAEENNVLRIGQNLQLTPGPWKIRVEKAARLLKLYNCAGGSARLFAVFDIGIGRQNLTPTADFVISVRQKNPDWYAPGGRLFKYGEPENILGTRFLKLAATGEPSKPLLGLGIHGTPHTESITRSLSGGCIRMHNADVEYLSTLVPVGTPVEIVE